MGGDGKVMIKIDLFCAKHIENFLWQLEYAKFFIGSVTFHLRVRTTGSKDTNFTVSATPFFLFGRC